MEISEEMIRELEEDYIVGRAMDKRKADLEVEIEKLVRDMNLLLTRYVEVEGELKEYEEEY